MLRAATSKRVKEKSEDRSKKASKEAPRRVTSRRITERSSSLRRRVARRVRTPLPKRAASRVCETPAKPAIVRPMARENGAGRRLRRLREDRKDTRNSRGDWPNWPRSSEGDLVARRWQKRSPADTMVGLLPLYSPRARQPQNKVTRFAQRVALETRASAYPTSPYRGRRDLQNRLEKRAAERNRSRCKFRLRAGPETRTPRAGNRADVQYGDCELDLWIIPIGSLNVHSVFANRSPRYDRTSWY